MAGISIGDLHPDYADALTQSLLSAGLTPDEILDLHLDQAAPKPQPQPVPDEIGPRHAAKRAAAQTVVSGFESQAANAAALAGDAYDTLAGRPDAGMRANVRAGGPVYGTLGEQAALRDRVAQIDTQPNLNETAAALSGDAVSRQEEAQQLEDQNQLGFGGTALVRAAGVTPLASDLALAYTGHPETLLTRAAVYAGAGGLGMGLTAPTTDEGDIDPAEMQRRAGLGTLIGGGLPLVGAAADISPLVPLGASSAAASYALKREQAKAARLGLPVDYGAVGADALAGFALPVALGVMSHEGAPLARDVIPPRLEDFEMPQAASPRADGRGPQSSLPPTPDAPPAPPHAETIQAIDKVDDSLLAHERAADQPSPEAGAVDLGGGPPTKGYNPETREKIKKFATRTLARLAAENSDQRIWYDASNVALKVRFGDTTTKLFDGREIADDSLMHSMLAATSPQRDPHDNLRMAMDALDATKRGLRIVQNDPGDGETKIAGATPIVTKMLGEIQSGQTVDRWDASHLQAQRAGKLPIRKPDESLYEWQMRAKARPKVISFYNNIKGDSNFVTNDVWIARLLFGDNKISSGSQYREATQRITAVANELGWTPSQVQASLWYHVRRKWSAQAMTDADALRRYSEGGKPTRASTALLGDYRAYLAGLNPEHLGQRDREHLAMFETGEPVAARRVAQDFAGQVSKQGKRWAGEQNFATALQRFDQAKGVTRVSEEPSAVGLGTRPERPAVEQAPEAGRDDLRRIGLLRRGSTGEDELSFAVPGQGNRTLGLKDFQVGTRRLTPEHAQALHAAMGMEVRPGENTNPLLKIYPLARAFGSSREEVVASLARKLPEIGWDYRIFGPNEHGKGFTPADFLKESYPQHVAWIFQPAELNGSFYDYAYTLPWRVTHEIGHGLSDPRLTEKYGGIGRRAGGLGFEARGPYSKPPMPLRLADALRSVEWEAEAFKEQRQLLQDKFGVQISDDEFRKENAVNLGGAVYRVLSGDFDSPGMAGVVPTALDPVSALARAKSILRAAAKEMGLDMSETLPSGAPKSLADRIAREGGSVKFGRTPADQARGREVGSAGQARSILGEIDTQKAVAEAEASHGLPPAEFAAARLRAGKLLNGPVEQQADLLATVHALAKRFEPEMEAARGKTTWAQVESDARDLLGKKGVEHLLKGTRMTPENAAAMRAVNIVASESIADVNRLAHELEANYSDATAVALEDALQKSNAFLSEWTGQGAELARALGVRAKLADTMRRAQSVAEAVRSLDMDPREKAAAIVKASKLEANGYKGKLSDAVTALANPTRHEKWITWLMASVLTPKSYFANAIGNLEMAGEEVLGRAIAGAVTDLSPRQRLKMRAAARVARGMRDEISGLERMRDSLSAEHAAMRADPASDPADLASNWRQREELGQQITKKQAMLDQHVAATARPTLADARDLFVGHAQGAWEVMSAMADGLADKARARAGTPREPIDPFRRELAAKMMIGDTTTKLDQPRASPFSGKGTLSAIAKAYTQAKFYPLSATDALFSHMAETGELYARSRARARGEGYSGADLAKRQWDLFQEARRSQLAEKPNEMAKAAHRFALEQTLQQPLGESARYILKGLNSFPEPIRTPLRMVFIFQRTPINAAKRIVHMLPGFNLLAKGTRDRLLGRSGVTAQREEFGRMAASSALVSALGMLYYGGKITGPFSPLGAKTGEKSARMAQGEQEYSYTTDSGKVIPLVGVDPASSAVVIALASFDAIQRGLIKGKDAEALMASVVNGFSNSFQNQSFLSGVAQATNAFQEPGALFGNLATNLATMAVPSELQYFARYRDPYFRDAQGILDRVKLKFGSNALYGQTADSLPTDRRLAVMEQAGEIPPKLDFFGEPVRQRGTLLMRKPITQMESTPLKAEVVRLFKNGALTGMGDPQRTIRGTQKQMPPWEYTHALHRARARAGVDLKNEIAGPMWATMTDDEKAGDVRSTYNSYWREEMGHYIDSAVASGQLTEEEADIANYGVKEGKALHPDTQAPAGANRSH